MTKRIICLILAIVLVLGLAATGIIYAMGTPTMTASSEAIRILKLEEGFSRTPYWDYSQWTVGYGTACPEDKRAEYTANGISEAEAEALLKQHIARFENELYKFMDRAGISLNQNQFDALLLFSYNCGSSWTYQTTSNIYNAVVSGANGNLLIDALTRWCNAGGQIKTYLLRRRQSEANIYLNGVYAQAQPADFGYVLYDANGGESHPNVQGFDAKLTSSIIPTPTYEGYTFDGWYTERTGGRKVEILDSSVRNARLYAHWKDADGNAPQEETPAGVKTTVTSNGVNIRTGPGTNYSKAGTANKGEQIFITETATGSGYTWGKFSGGWIALKYTDYETASKPEQKPEEKPEEKPQETPEAKPQEPAATAQKGTVKVSSRLKIRSGPSTAYGVAGYYYNGDRVEILEQKLAGSMLWGKTSKGWISMEYVTLDKTQEEPKPEQKPEEKPQTQPQAPQSTTRTGTVNVSSLLRIRSGPSTSTSVVGYLSPKQKVTITEQKTSGSVTWGKVSKGWVSMDYIDLDPISNSSGSTSSGNTNSGNTSSGSKTLTGTVNVSSQLRIRAGAGTSYAVTGYLTNKQKVTITEQKTVGGTTWGKVSKGWISMDYVTLDSGSSSQTQTNTNTDTGTTRTVTADCLKVRASASTSSSVVAYMKKGVKVQILETKTVGSITWGRTSKGWISLKYTK